MSLEINVMLQVASEIKNLQTILATVTAKLELLHESNGVLNSSILGLNTTIEKLVNVTTATVSAPIVTPVVTSSVIIASANPNRKGFIIFNNSANSAYVTFGGVAVASTCTKLVATYASWEVYSGAIYKGPISAIRNSGTGNISVYELT